MNAATLHSMERIGIMTWEEDDNIAICHHCGLIRPEDDHCQCVRARMAREDATQKRRNRIILFLFACWILASLGSMTLAFVFLFLEKYSHAAFSFMALGCIVLPVFLSVSFKGEPNAKKEG
jgi:hypothetical protein